MGKRSLDDARTFGRSIQPTHDLQPEAGSADGDSVFAILDVNEIEADAQPKKITFTGVANVVGPLLTPTAIPAAGSDTQVQFNDGGFFGADGGLTYNKTTDALSAGAFIPTGSSTPTNGIYLQSANTVSVATNSTERLRINSTGQLEALSSGTAAAPTFTFNSDPNTGIYSPGADQLALSTNGTGRLFVDSTGKIYCNSTAGSRLEIVNSTNTGGGGENLHSYTAGYYIWGLRNETNNLAIESAFGGNIIFRAEADGVSSSPGSAQERLRITSSGQLLVGTSSARNNFFNTSGLGGPLQIEGANSSAQRVISNIYGVNGAAGPILLLGKHRSNSIGATTLVANGDECGVITFQGGDDTEFVEAAQIKAQVDDTPGANDMPGRLVFSTTADGASSPTERMRISSGGTTTLTSAASTAPFVANIGASEVARIDSAGRLLVGTASTSNVAKLVVQGTSSSSTDFGYMHLVRGGNPTVDQYIGAVDFSDLSYTTAASIAAVRDGGTWSGTSKPSRLIFSLTPDGTTSSAERLRITNDGVIGYNQPAPVAVDATATLTVANLKTGIITSTTAAAVTMTLPTGTLTEGGFSGLYNNFTFQWSVINTGATNAVTVAAGTAHTLVGSGTVAAGVSGRFASRRTAANTFVTYRLS